MQQDTIVKERTALAVQPEQGEDTIDLLELFMGLLATGRSLQPRLWWVPY